MCSTYSFDSFLFEYSWTRITHMIATAEQMNETMLYGSFKISTPDTTATTVERFKKAEVRTTGRCVSAKLTRIYAPAPENTPI